jgi:hypothetical protein
LSLKILGGKIIRSDILGISAVGMAVDMFFRIKSPDRGKNENHVKIQDVGSQII